MLATCLPLHYIAAFAARILIMTLAPEGKDLDAWLGGQRVVDSDLPCAELDKLAATLGHSGTGFSAGMELPPLWHWLFFQRPVPQSRLDADGHPQRGDFLPPVRLPRRMWAGSRLEFIAPLHAAKPARQQSEITAISQKQGKSGPLVFVTVSHSISQQDRICLREQQDLVYRDSATASRQPGTVGTAPQPPADYQRTVVADPALLFRYSALTFNAHRIHYDRDYARDVEHYPGLVVHGPLLATMLLDLWQEHVPGQTLAQFHFRALAPVFDLAPFKLCGNLPDDAGRCLLWVVDNSGQLCLQAEALIRP